MTVEDVEEKLIKKMSEICSREAGLIQADMPLHELGLASMSLIDLLVYIEQEFNLQLMKSGLSKEDFKSIQSLAACIIKESDNKNG